MSGYPGAYLRPRRAVAVAALLALTVGLGGGWLMFHRGTASMAAPAGPCPGSRHDAVDRDQAAACLVTRYFALENVSAAQRDVELAKLVVPGELTAARNGYQPLEAKVAAEYATVAATKLTPNPNLPDSDYDGQAWVAFVDSYKDGSAPLSQWWIASFELRWQEGRWWLASGGIGLLENATPPSSATAPGAPYGFDTGWAAAGHA